MGKLNTWLRAELEKVSATAIKAPDKEIEEGETVIGTLDDLDTRKMFALRGIIGDVIDSKKKELRHLMVDNPDHQLERHPSSTCQICSKVQTLTMLIEKVRLVDTLFWTGLKCELDDNGVAAYLKGGAVAIRKGWKIVACKPDSPHHLAVVDVILGGGPFLV
ncbi:MAG: hypothetical protein AAB455_01220 [Patescibacteria group bacterium]